MCRAQAELKSLQALHQRRCQHLCLCSPHYQKVLVSTHDDGAELAQRHPEVPRLTAKQRDALRYFNAIAKVRKQAPAGAANERQDHLFDAYLLSACLRLHVSMLSQSHDAMTGWEVTHACTCPLRSRMRCGWTSYCSRATSSCCTTTRCCTHVRMLPNPALPTSHSIPRHVRCTQTVDRWSCSTARWTLLRGVMPRHQIRGLARVGAAAAPVPAVGVAAGA